MESKSERFKRIAAARVNKISEFIRLLGNCAFTGNYEYTEDQVDLIFEKLHFELDKAQTLFDMEKRRFSLASIPKTHYPSVKLKLPDKTIIQAIAIDDVNFPAIEVKLLKKDRETRTVCCVEYNPSRVKGEQLCVGMICNKSDENRFYESFDDRVLSMATEFKGLTVGWDTIARLISKSVSQILKKQFKCKASIDDVDFWTVSFKDNRLTAEEIEKLLLYFDVSDEEFESSMPEKGRTDVADFDMTLSERLLGKQLGYSWKKSIPEDDGLMLIGVQKIV